VCHTCLAINGVSAGAGGVGAASELRNRRVDRRANATLPERCATQGSSHDCEKRYAGSDEEAGSPHGVNATLAC
jgi:hypothetical protein